MKVILTLNRGSFYFMKNVHLVRGIPTEVDLSTLDKVELTGLKLNVKGGTILTDKDISDFNTGVEPILTVETSKKVVDEVVEVVEPVLEDTVEEVETLPEEETPVEVVEDTVETETPKETPKKFNKKK